MGYNTTWSGGFRISPDVDVDFEKRINSHCSEDHSNNAKAKEYGISTRWYDLRIDGNYLEWVGDEKSYDIENWIPYLISEFFEPNGYKLSGEMEWSGEEQGDLGKVVVEENNVKILRGKIVYEEDVKCDICDDTGVIDRYGFGLDTCPCASSKNT